MLVPDATVRGFEPVRDDGSSLIQAGSEMAVDQGRQGARAAQRHEGLADRLVLFAADSGEEGRIGRQQPAAAIDQGDATGQGREDSGVERLAALAAMPDLETDCIVSRMVFVVIGHRGGQ